MNTRPPRRPVRRPEPKLAPNWYRFYQRVEELADQLKPDQPKPPAAPKA